jgi:hypothetical protein
MNSIRLRGPADILSALPYQLGYHPTDAVVVVTLKGRAIGLVQRLDLPTAEQCGEAVAALLPALTRELPDAVLLVGYESRVGESLPVLEALAHSCHELALDVLDRLVVRDGRWFAPDCAGGDCCPADGTPLPPPEDTPAVADFVALEMAPLKDRASLADQLAPDPDRQAEVDGALGAATAHHDCPAPAPGGRGAGAPHGVGDHALAVQRLRWLATWAVVSDVSAARPPIDGLSPEEVAALALSLRDVALRDAVIAWLCPGTLPLDCLDGDLVDQLRCSLPEPAWSARPATDISVVAGRRLQSRLVELCRALPDGQAAPMLTVLANLAWWQGDGALARTALERALVVEPGYRLARLLDRLVDLAIRPRATA